MPLSFPANPTVNQTYTYGGNTYTFNGNLWTKGAGGASLTVSATPPASPSDGSLWLNNESGDVYVYANNGWLLVGGSGGGGGSGAAGATGATGPTVSNAYVWFTG